MKRLRWYCVRALEQLGWAGAAALFLFAVAGGYLAYDHVSTAQNDGDLNTPLHQGDASQASPSERSERLELEQLERTLKSAALEDNLQALHDAARGAGIELKRLEYQMSDEKRWRFKQYQIVAPVTSSYPRVREFIGTALARVPSLALDHVSFQKRKVGDATVDAELRFTLFLPDAS